MSTPTPRTDKTSESLLSKTFLTSYVTMQELARTLERELAAEREKVRVLREAAVNVAMISRVWLTVWYDKFTTETVQQFERAEGVLLATLATEETK